MKKGWKPKLRGLSSAPRPWQRQLHAHPPSWTSPLVPERQDSVRNKGLAGGVTWQSQTLFLIQTSVTASTKISRRKLGSRVYLTARFKKLFFATHLFPWGWWSTIQDSCTTWVLPPKSGTDPEISLGWGRSFPGVACWMRLIQPKGLPETVKKLWIKQKRIGYGFVLFYLQLRHLYGTSRPRFPPDKKNFGDATYLGVQGSHG